MQMTQAKMTPAATLKSLDAYVQSLETGAPAQAFLGDLIGNRIDRVRLWQFDSQRKTMVKEVALPKRQGKPSGYRRGKGLIDKDLLAMLDQIEDPEISVDLSLNLDSGAVSLAVEMEPALVGQDLSALASETTDAKLPIFEDEPFDDSYWSADEAATYFDVAKSTITRKVRAGDLIGFKLFKNALYIPKEQVDGKSLVRGISDVLKSFEGEHYDAWQFLTSDIFYGEPLPRPLDRLRNAKGDSLQDVLSEVKVAAKGFEFGDHM
jgi:hypothetical protein|tara:strand:- start:11567 stop:12358 length:792 start_codon:yes stop_codon:yes gene_type:complete